MGKPMPEWLRNRLKCAQCEGPTRSSDDVTWRGRNFCSPECARDAIDEAELEDDEEPADLEDRLVVALREADSEHKRSDAR